MKIRVFIGVKELLFIGGVLCNLLLNAQYEDDFEDDNLGDTPDLYTPALSGNTGDFILVDEAGDKQLRSNKGQLGTAGNYYLSIASEAIYEASWEFYVNLKFGTSGSNYVDFFLTSDNSDLTSTQNGYFVRVGDTNDRIALFKVANGVSTEDDTPLITTSNGLVNSSASNPFIVRVTRDDIGNWEMLVDEDALGSFVSVGSTFDDEISSSSFFGLLIQQSTAAGPADSHFFDDFVISGTPIPDTTPPTIQSSTAISATQVDIQFSEDVEEITSETTSNYSLTGGVSITNAERDASNNAIVHLTTSPLTNGQNYTVTINSVDDLAGNFIAANSTSDFQYILIEEAEEGDIVINEFLADTEGSNDDFVELFNRSDKYIDLTNWVIEDGTGTGGPTNPFTSYILAPGEYLILFKNNSDVDYSAFGESLQIGTSAFTFNNDNDTIRLKSDSGNLIAEIGYGSSPGEGISLELINPNDPCFSIFSYAPSIAPAGSTPGSENSVFDDTPDTTPPTITSFGFTTSLMINFSEPMDAMSLENGTYQATGGLTVDQVIVEGGFPESAEIVFNESIVLGESYDVTISNVTDCSGNEIEETTITFSFGRPPIFNELLITEILFDEDPSVGLPEREFIEIYNASSDIISTEDMSLSDATGVITLPTFNMLPGTYKVLTTTSGASEFSDAIGVTSFPSLSNSGEPLALIYELNLIFSIEYDPGWHEESRSDGGYSLEMIDYTNPCIESAANWMSSIASEGGTPGFVNSVNNPQSVPDNIAPELLNVTAIAADTLILQFNEKLNPTSVDAIVYDFSPDLGVDSSFLLAENASALYTILSADLIPNEQYTLTVDGVSDCNGNEVENNEITFALPIQATDEEILLSEVLFNPRTNGVDFVELYNNSENYITLKNWQLARIDSEGLDDRIVISDDELVLNPGDFLVLTEDPEVLLNNYPKGTFSKFLEVIPFPTYSNDTGNVVLINALGGINEQFFYDEEFHYDLLEDVDGVSLERVSYNESASNSDNWRSASSTEGFATPGYANSQSRTGTAPSGKVVPEPKVFIPGDAARGRDFTLINYQLDQPGKFANVDIFDQSGRLVKNLANGVLLATSGFLRWDGETDEGSMARMGYYLIIFEIYDNSGNTEIIKETVVVGRDF